MLKLKRNKKFGQVMIEFTFSMIIVFLMIYSLAKILEWSGKEFADKRIQHDQVLKSTNNRSYTSIADSEQIQQISPFFSSGADMNAIWTN